MYYDNLTNLMKSDERGRAYYDSLPTAVQIELSIAADSIHTVEDMHLCARSAESVMRRNILGEYSAGFAE